MRWRARPRRGEAVAVDLGTSRTRVLVPRTGTLLDEPTMLAYAGGRLVAVGDDAWKRSEAGDATLRLPVRGGVVVDADACADLLVSLLHRAGASHVDQLVVSTPVAVTGEDAARSRAVAARVAQRPPVVVESVLAAAMTARVDVTDPAARLVCDIGAGVTELAAIGSGRVLASAVLPRGVADYRDDPEAACAALPDALSRVLGAVDGAVAGDLAARPLLLVGGGALVDGLVERLTDVLRLPVHAWPAPRSATVTGLARCLTSYDDERPVA